MTGDYNPEKINFECLREVMGEYEEKCGRLSDYGLKYVKYITEGCEMLGAREIIEGLRCWWE